MTEVAAQFNLSQVLEALLFSTSEPLSIKDIQAVIRRFHDQAEKIRAKVPEGEDSPLESHLPFPLEWIDEVPALVTSTQIREAIEQISQGLGERDAVYEVQETNLGFRMVVKAEFGFWVRLLREDPKPMRLSQAALETLAIIAYRQPVVRSEMESIRGVSVDSSLQKLVEYELVYVVGRAELPGRPVQYGTTDKFLEFVGVTSLEELPSTDVISPQQLDEWINKAEEPEHLGDEDMGLPSNDDDNLENQQAHLGNSEDQEELGLRSPDDPIYAVESPAKAEDGSEEDEDEEEPQIADSPESKT